MTIDVPKLTKYYVAIYFIFQVLVAKSHYLFIFISARRYTTYLRNFGI